MLFFIQFLSTFAAQFLGAMAITPFFYLLAQLFIQFTPTGVVIKPAAPAYDSLTKHIYLSFDDGPLPGTANCIDICLNEKVPATFFQVGLHQSRSKHGQKLYHRILSNKSMFALCNHSFSHAYGKYLDYYNNPDTALTDFLKAKAVLQPDNNITRLPGNNGWSTNFIKKSSRLVRPLVRKLDSAGFNVVGWDLQWHFNEFGRPIQTPAVMFALVDSLFTSNKTKTKNHLVILMHDPMFRRPSDSLKLVQFIRLLKSNPAYKFEKLTTYPGLKGARY
jgi:peptidoglycan/xylan/chitin deacetylase (PgdA/CDA1 family)